MNYKIKTVSLFVFATLVVTAFQNCEKAPRRLRIGALRNSVMRNPSSPGQSLNFGIQAIFTIGSNGSGNKFQSDIVNSTNGIGVIAHWPDVPENFSIPDYKTKADAYTDMVLSTADRRNATGASLPHLHVVDKTAFNASGRLNFDVFQLNSYVFETGATTPKWGEAMALMPTIISAGLLGGNMTSANVPGYAGPVNLVRSQKRHFRYAEGRFENLLDGSWNQFWYDIMPNIYALQMYDVFASKDIEASAPAGEPTFEELVRQTADTHYEVANYLTAGADYPSFDYANVDIISRNPDRFVPVDTRCAVAPVFSNRRPGETNCIQGQSRYTSREPEAAAGYAWIGLAAHQKFGDEKYLRLADWGMKFLEKYPHNPLYEMLLPYGALTAARMNAQYGRTYNIQKHLDHLFSPTSPNRLGFHIMADKWGGLPAHGLAGSYNHDFGGYAFYMNTVAHITTLAPIARYNSSYAQVMGKYLLHAASNSKVFFSSHVSRDNQEPRTLQFLDSHDSRYANAMPYEGVKENGPGGQKPFLTGDNGKYPNGTDLCTYCGSVSGYLGAILGSTSDPTIPQWDLLSTDFFRPDSFATVLIYNPHSANRDVTVDLNSIKKISRRSQVAAVRIYDSVGKTWLLNGSTSDQSIRLQLRGHQAVVLVLVPESANAEMRGGKLVDTNSNVVIDYLSDALPAQVALEDGPPAVQNTPSDSRPALVAREPEAVAALATEVPLPAAPDIATETFVVAEVQPPQHIKCEDGQDAIVVGFSDGDGRARDIYGTDRIFYESESDPDRQSAEEFGSLEALANRGRLNAVIRERVNEIHHIGDIFVQGSQAQSRVDTIRNVSQIYLYGSLQVDMVKDSHHLHIRDGVNVDSIQNVDQVTVDHGNMRQFAGEAICADKIRVRP